MRIGELLENDPFKGIKDFAANFKKGAEEVTGKSPSRQTAVKKSSPFDRYKKEDLRDMFKKIINKEELDSQEIKISKELYREFNKF